MKADQFRLQLAHRIWTCVALLLAAGCAKPPALAPSPNLYVQSAQHPFEEVPLDLQSNLVSVVYATDRRPVEDKGKLHYSADRSREVAFGLCTVQMGESDMAWDELAYASVSAKRKRAIALSVPHIDERGRFPWLGPPVEINGRWTDSPEYQRRYDDQAEVLHWILRKQLAQTPRKELILFIHGYNNTFESAAYKCAQLWHFAGRGGVPVIFSWPAGSSGLLRGYTRDRESGEFANPHLKRFIRTLASCPEVERIHLVAHSRGTDVLTTAVRELHIECKGANEETRDQFKLGQFILAAPDIDLDVFVERLSEDRVGFVAEQTTIYVSPHDKAIGLADWLFASRRRLGQLTAGDLGKGLSITVKRHPVLAIVDVRAKSDRRGHGYFLSSPAALSDVILVLRDHLRPGAQHGRPLFDSPRGFWLLREDYPSLSPASK